MKFKSLEMWSNFIYIWALFPHAGSRLLLTTIILCTMGLVVYYISCYSKIKTKYLLSEFGLEPSLKL